MLLETLRRDHGLAVVMVFHDSCVADRTNRVLTLASRLESESRRRGDVDEISHEPEQDHFQELASLLRQ